MAVLFQTTFPSHNIVCCCEETVEFSACDSRLNTPSVIGSPAASQFSAVCGSGCAKWSKSCRSVCTVPALLLSLAAYNVGMVLRVALQTGYSSCHLSKRRPIHTSTQGYWCRRCMIFKRDGETLLLAKNGHSLGQDAYEVVSDCCF